MSKSEEEKEQEVASVREKLFQQWGRKWESSITENQPMSDTIKNPCKEIDATKSLIEDYYRGIHQSTLRGWGGAGGGDIWSSTSITEAPTMVRNARRLDSTAPSDTKAMVERVLYSLRLLVEADSDMVALRVISENRALLGMGLVLDTIPSVQNLLEEEYVTRHIDKSTHYYRITDVGRSALKFDHL